ncbi:MAG: competence/damage-inducible protein A [Candidatus Lernaella stagnicola]|nr:competence/damage-inducible protein A [Candidatus Lernaella stagnicola]
MRLELVLTGGELLDGRRVDTHAQRLANILRPVGLSVGRATLVGDRQTDIEDALRGALQRVDIVLCTGGLGPTIDDRTRDAAAVVLDLPLVEDAPTVAWLQELFGRFGREMKSNNRRQAMFPQGARILPNQAGTAPGFAVEKSGKWAIFAPGPPAELELMAREQIVPLLEDVLPPRQAIATTSLRTFGFTESGLDKRLREIDFGDVELAYTASAPEIILTLTAAGADAQAAEAKVADARHLIQPIVADAVISDDGRTLEEVIGTELTRRGQTLAIAESCTGGLIAMRCTDVPGSSEWFLQGAVTYSNEAKIQRLDVAAALLEEHGAVSREVAEAMAAGMRQSSQSDWALAVTGIAGPTGGSAAKPVGTVFGALVGPAGAETWHDRFPGDRGRVRRFAAQRALDQLRRTLIS